jgi:hypothetical protein
LSFYAYALSSTKLEIREEWFCMEARGGGAERVGALRGE